MKDLLRHIEEDSRLTPEQLSVLCHKEVGDIKDMIRKCEADGTILGYSAIIDWEKVDDDRVNALIELNIIPQRERGFDKVAERIANYPEVKSLYLMSGGFDLAVFIEGKTMKEVAFFVARKLASLEEVTATATHFVLTKFKEKGVIFGKEKKDERGNL
ncbi:MAG: Lrp/AsnC family transcriptional regulator [Clostridia bacterium]|nr:Lrp/AsnC family transcriptional regulator [Clostridia bacterium]